jgi:hypothetical protein
MAGPYPPHQGTGPIGPFAAPPAYPPGFVEPYPVPYGDSYQFDTGPVSAAYPGPLPPPVPYPRRGRWWVGTVLLSLLAAIAAVAVVVVVSGGRQDPGPAAGEINAASAKTAIQGYLDALLNGDLQSVSRNTLCGLYDGVKDRRADDALAKLSSDTFQKQFAEVNVTSVDTIVFASPASAQVLFSMRVVPGVGLRGSGPMDRQGVVQLLTYNNEILVCSYVMRTAGAF